MITTIRRQGIIIILLSFVIHSQAQELRAFNQNASGSNRGLSISFSPVYSMATNSGNDSLLFRGSGAGFRFGADYFFGKAGISFSSGFGSSSPDNATINSFLKRFPVPAQELTVTKARQQNMYLLLGPSVRFGNKVELYAHAKGGLFINNSGLVSIQQKGAQRAAYRNESTAKSVYPGFLTGLGVQYKTKSDVWSFGIGLDYMNTKSEVNNYDVRRGGGIEALKLSRNITDVVTGITVRYNILSPRDQASGQSTGKRQIGKPKYEDIKVAARERGSGLATGKTYQPGKPHYGNLTMEESADESCGTVTQRITNPDGTREEMSFACPDDAANYNSKMKMDGGMPNRISMNVTVPKQTQGATFGEKVNQGLHAAGSALSQGASLCIISGTLTWGSSGERMGIVTNKSLMAGTTSIAGSSVRGGSITMNSQTSSTRTTQQNSFGTMVRLSAREAGSGMATGKRSRDAGNGMATGRRQYEPIFAEGQGDVCNPCLAAAKMSGAHSNPLYKDKGMSGSNPMFEGKERVSVNADEDCDGVAEADIFLIDARNGAIVARTKTERCGGFFFANIPEGDYVVKVSGSFISKKGYDIYLKSKSDLRGGVTMADDWDAQLRINTSGGDNEMTQKAGISTSRSNIRSKTLTIIEADLDGDGEFESTKVLAGLNDGTTKDVTAMSRISSAASVKKVTVRGWDPGKKQTITGSANAVKEYTISIDDDNGVLLTSQYENGTKEDARVKARVSHHPNVIQFVISLDDQYSDEAGNGRVKTKSNIKNDRLAAGDVNGDGATEAAVKVKTKSNIKNDLIADGDVGDNVVNAKTKISKSRSNIQNNRMINDEEGDDIWSPRSNIKILGIATGDVDGDGKAELIVGGIVPGGSVISAAMRPGEPIPGIDVKMGKNPGGQSLQTTTSNANGEFEFTKLEAGDYTFTIEQKIFIEDETFVSIGGSNTRAQDHNSSRSNKSGIADNEMDNEDAADNIVRKGWDGTIKGGGKTKAQDHNSSRSNKSGIIDNDMDNEDDADNAARKGWDGTVKGKIISRSDKGTITLEANQPVTFRWTPLVPKPKEPVTYRIKVWQLMQGQNSTQARHANLPIVEKTVTNASEATIAGIYTGPCKPPYLCDFIWSVQAINKEGNPEGKTEEGSFSAEQAQTKIQNSNTVRSNPAELKSILIEADLDGDGEFETDVTSKVSNEIKPNDETGAAQQKAGISTSRSNIRNRSALVDKGDDLYIGYGTTIINGEETSLKILYSAKKGKTGSAK